MDQQILIDRSEWKKPTYSGHYDDRAIFYEGISCRCKKCELSFVFTAIEQKRKFEMEKEYPGWLPSLCQVCEDRWQDICIKESEFDALWDRVKGSSNHDEKFLNDWISILLEAESYRRKGYEQKIMMIKKIISKLHGQGA